MFKRPFVMGIVTEEQVSVSLIWAGISSAPSMMCRYNGFIFEGNLTRKIFQVVFDGGIGIFLIVRQHLLYQMGDQMDTPPECRELDFDLLDHQTKVRKNGVVEKCGND